MHANESIGLKYKSLKGYIWGLKGQLRHYMFWRILSVLVITPFPVITQRIVDSSILNRDLNELWYYTCLSLALLLVHFLTAL